MGWLNCRCNGSPTPNEFPTYVPQLHILLGHSLDMRCPQIEDEIRRWFIPTLQRFQESMFQLLILIPSVSWIVGPPVERLCRRAKLASKLCGYRSFIPSASPRIRFDIVGLRADRWTGATRGIGAGWTDLWMTQGESYAAHSASLNSLMMSFRWATVALFPEETLISMSVRMKAMHDRTVKTCC